MIYESFTWGDLARVNLLAPKKFRPGELGEVCGIWEITTEENSKALEEPLGTTIYTVEFSDGVSVEIPDR
jgi:hypothetical protein